MANNYVCIDVYTVKAGDTLYSVSQQYNVSVELLMRVNRIRNPYNLRIGTRLCIPGKAPQQPDCDCPPAGNPDGETQQPGGPSCNGVIHTVKEGDSLYMIAKLHKVTLDALMRANPDIDPYNLQIGAELCVPTC